MKIAALISGGVDSSVALALLKQQGHDVTAFYLKIWLEDELSHLGDCPWEEDLSYVEAVCKKLDVPLEVLSLQKEYHDRVVFYAIEQIKRGFTPNPDIMCNRHIKFGAFFEKIGNDFDKIATGHYAQIIETPEGFLLKQAPDAIKDQTYFLSHLTQNQLSRLIFPIGHLTKDDVRDYAHTFNLPTKDRKDSQGICFLGKIPFPEFIRHHVGIKKGDIICYETGEKIGEHDGFWYHTIGQRKGLKLSGGPWYVVKKDVVKNKVYVSNHYFSSEKKRNNFIATSCNWFLGKCPEKKNLRVKLRHGKEFYNAQLVYNDDKTVTVNIDQHDQGIASGQFVAFYDGDVCLGGGVIETN